MKRTVTIHHRGTRWTVRWYAPSGKRPQRTFATEAEAEDFATRQRAAFLDHPQAREPAVKVTLGEFRRRVLELAVGPAGAAVRPATVAVNRSVVDALIDAWGPDTPLGAITRADALAYSVDLRVGPLATTTANKHRRTLRALFEVAVRQLGLLESNPFARLGLDPEPAPMIRHLAPADFHRLLSVCQVMPNATWWTAFLAVCYTAALRRGEATHLWWCDVDFGSNRISVVNRGAFRIKTGRTRRVPIPAATARYLIDLQLTTETHNPYVFVSQARAVAAGDRPIVLAGLTDGLARRVKAGGLPHTTFHDLRRSGITEWAREMDIHVVRQLAGHSKVDTTIRHYAAVPDDVLDQAATVMARALAG